MICVRISGSKVSHELKLEFPSVFSASCMPASTTGDHHGTRFILTSSKVGYISLSLKNKKLITWKKIEDSVIGFSKSTFLSFRENENYLISKRFCWKNQLQTSTTGVFLKFFSCSLLGSAVVNSHPASISYSKCPVQQVYE